MTLPLDKNLPFRQEQIEEGGKELTSYVRDLTSELQTMYSDMVDNIDGNVRDWSPSITGGTVAGAATYAANGQYGLYLRQGIRTTVFFYASWTAHTGNGDLVISLPYIVKSLNSVEIFLGNVETSGLAFPAGTTSLSIKALQNTRTAKIICSGSGVASSYLQLAGTGSITGQVFYIGQDQGG